MIFFYTTALKSSRKALFRDKHKLLLDGYAVIRISFISTRVIVRVCCSRDSSRLFDPLTDMFYGATIGVSAANKVTFIKHIIFAYFFVFVSFFIISLTIYLYFSSCFRLAAWFGLFIFYFAIFDNTGIRQYQSIDNSKINNLLLSLSNSYINCEF